MKKQACLAFVLGSIAFGQSVAFGQDAWTTRMSLANRFQAEGQYAEARKHYQLAVTESEYSKTRHAQSLNNLAAHLYETGEYAQAEGMYKDALAEWRALEETRQTGVTLSNLATLYRKTGKYAEALELFAEAETTIRKADGPESPELATCLLNWSEVYRASGRFAEAETLAAKALGIAEKIFAPADGRLSHTLHAYAAALQSNGKPEESVPLHERALALRETTYGGEHPYVAASLTALVSLYLEHARYEHAEPLALRALAIWEAKLGSGHLHTAIALNNLAQVYRFQERGAQAEPLYRRAIDILRRLNSPDAAKPLTNLGDFYMGRGRTRAALALYKMAEQTTRETFGGTGPQTTQAQLKTAEAYQALGRKTEAARVYKEVKAATIARTAVESR